jgi:hypothetical protein
MAVCNRRSVASNALVSDTTAAAAAYISEYKTTTMHTLTMAVWNGASAASYAQLAASRSVYAPPLPLPLLLLLMMMMMMSLPLMQLQAMQELLPMHQTHRSHNFAAQAAALPTNKQLTFTMAVRSGASAASYSLANHTSAAASFLNIKTHTETTPCYGISSS